jgi:L-fuculose-phosphate aldolase
MNFDIYKNRMKHNSLRELQLDNDGNIAYDIVGIKGHGVVAIDTSPWRAFEHIERLEHICQIVLASGKY